MNIELSALEARVIGCLIEKQIATPDQYPLSLNAVVNACNQKTNRDPVLDLDERAVQPIVDALIRKHMVIERSGFGSRVPKYQQVFCNTEFASLKFASLETAILCELMLRGPQTPGELRTRAARLSDSNETTDIDSALLNLQTRQDGPFVARLPREAGRRDSRYVHLFCGDVADSEVASSESTTLANNHFGTAPLSVNSPLVDEDVDRLTQLELLVEELRNEVSGLKRRFDGK